MAKVMNWVIYVLKNPRTNEVRYVGWTNDPRKRMQGHLNSSRYKTPPTTHKAKWILSLLSIGIEPVMEIIESGSGDGWAEAEKRWIAFYRSLGTRLVNGTDGGDGAPGYVPTAETRARISEAGKGRKPSPENRLKSIERLRAANLGRKMTPEERARLTAAVKGRKQTPEHRAKVSAAHKGRTYSAETRAKMSAAAKVKIFTAEHRAKMSAAHMGRPGTASPEHLQRMIALSQTPEALAKRKASLSETMRNKPDLAERMARMRTPEAIAKRVATRAANKAQRGEA